MFYPVDCIKTLLLTFYWCELIIRRKSHLCLKYKYAYDVARFIAFYICNDFVKFIYFLIKNYGKFIFIPVPINKRRFNERGFNQSELILNKLKVNSLNLLKRIKNTEHQASLSSLNRDNNLKNAFILDNKFDLYDFKDFNIIIFDDVVTTGNTIDQCAKVLRESGFKNKIIGITVAGWYCFW